MPSAFLTMRIDGEIKVASLTSRVPPRILVTLYLRRISFAVRTGSASLGSILSFFKVKCRNGLSDTSSAEIVAFSAAPARGSTTPLMNAELVTTK